MTPDDVRAAAEQLVALHEDFAPLFGKDQAQDHVRRNAIAQASHEKTWRERHKGVEFLLL